MPSWFNRATLLAAAITLAIICAMLALSQCDRRRSAAAQAKVDRGQASASIDSGAVALNTADTIAQNGAQEDATAKEGINAIRTAPEADRSAATVAAACRLRAYRDTDRCARLRAANTAKP